MVKWIKARYELLMYGSHEKMSTKQLVRRIRRGETCSPDFNVFPGDKYQPKEAARQIDDALNELAKS